MRKLSVFAVLFHFLAFLPISASAADKELIEDGEMAYDTNCSTCHGMELVSSGLTFDLKKLRPDEQPRFVNSVLNGKNNRMPPWKGVLEMKEIESIWAFIRYKVDNKK